MRILGAILAGGRARRFGSDKALAEWGGIALIDRVAAVLTPQVDAVVVCGRAGGIPDRPPGIGPLGGIAAALRHACERGFDAVVSVPCDTPLLPHDLISSVEGGATPRFVAELPVIGWWPVGLAARIDGHIEATESYSVRAFARAVGAAEIRLDDDIPNINTPADLAALAASSRPA